MLNSLYQPLLDGSDDPQPSSSPDTRLSIHQPTLTSTPPPVASSSSNTTPSQSPSPSSTTSTITSATTATTAAAAPAKPPVTPLPKTQLGLLGACLYGVLFSQNVLFPFLPFMVSSFFPDLPITELGYRAGYLGAAFPAGLALSSYGWGRLADRIGRKPCLIVGLACTCVCITAFGFSGTFVMAMVWRFLAGALNGNNGIVKTMVSEVCDDSNMAKGFSLIGLLGGLARATSPAIGGYLAEPATQYEALRGYAWLEEWPYALPCVVGGVIAAVSLLLVMLRLDETLPGAWSWSSIRKRLGGATAATQRNTHAAAGYSRMESDRTAISVPAVDSAAPSSPAAAAESATVAAPAAPAVSILSLLTMPAVAISIYLNAIMAFLAIVQTEVIPLWVVLQPADGGFAMQPTAIATLLMLLGPFQMAHQVLLYPRLTARYGSKQLFRRALTCVAVFCALMPFTTYLNRVDGSGWLSWVGLAGCFIAMVLCRVTSFTCCFVLLNNACTPHIKASANGLAQSTASLAQIVGPVMGGLVFAWSVGVGSWPIDFGLIWQVQAVVCVFGVWLCGRLPDSVNQKAEVNGGIEAEKKEAVADREVREEGGVMTVGGAGGAGVSVDDKMVWVEEQKECKEESAVHVSVAAGPGRAGDAIELIIRPNDVAR